MEDLVNRVEAVLYSSGKKVDIAELKRVCRTRDEDAIRHAIEELKKRYDETTSLMIVDEGKDIWKMNVREKYLHFIRKIVTETELPKTIMETLAVIAWKHPAMQSDIIKIRTNKAYDHIKELIDAGFIESSKYGRTKLLKLTKKFYDYFDLEGEKDIKEVFGTIAKPKIPQTKVQEFVEEKEDENKKVEDKLGKLNVYEEKTSVEVFDADENIQNIELDKIKILGEETAETEEDKGEIEDIEIKEEEK